MIDQYQGFIARLPGWLDQLGTLLLAAAAAIMLALIVHYAAFRLLRRLATASESPTDDMLVKRLTRPTRYAMVALGIALGARETPALAEIWNRVSGFIMPALLGWMALAILHSLVRAMEMHNESAHPDDHDIRRHRTRLAIFSRIASFVIIFITVGLMLLTIPGVREIGVTLMASAGLAGLAVGAAAQPALKSLIAGFQLALTEPINIDDVVIIDGEWGRVEDIRTTYVVVRCWDERRLIVPTSKFLEETFQNWTRESAELLAPVFLHLDPLTEIDRLRAEFERKAKAHPLWDGRVAKLQVTDSTPGSIEVRLLASAKDASNAFDLRCDLRESMLAWMRENMPDAVPRRRVESSVPVDAAAEG